MRNRTWRSIFRGSGALCVGVAVVVAVAALPLTAFAQTPPAPGATSTPLVPCGQVSMGTAGMCEFCHIFVLLHNIFNFLALQVTPTLSVGLFLVGGFALMFSGGNAGLRQTGTKILTGTIIGIVIVLLSWILVNTTINVIAGFGVESNPAGKPAGFPWPWNAPAACPVTAGTTPAPAAPPALP